MAKTKFQLFLDGAATERIAALCKRFDWTGGQAVERLLSFYAKSQSLLSNIDIDQLDEHWGCEPESFTEDGKAVYSDCLVFSDPEGFFEPEAVAVPPCVVNLVQELKDGLTPPDGFGKFGSFTNETEEG